MALTMFVLVGQSPVHLQLNGVNVGKAGGNGRRAEEGTDCGGRSGLGGIPGERREGAACLQAIALELTELRRLRRA